MPLFRKSCRKSDAPFCEVHAQHSPRRWIAHAATMGRRKGTALDQRIALSPPNERDDPK